MPYGSPHEGTSSFLPPSPAQEIATGSAELQAGSASPGWPEVWFLLMVPKPRSEEGETRPRGSSGMGQGLLSAFLPGAEPHTGSPKAKELLLTLP